jgi:predicted RNA-binding protein with RPS1 domain
MPTAFADRLPSEQVDVAVNEMIMEEENRGGFKRGELKPFLESLEIKYGIPLNTLKNRYYREVKDKVKPNVTTKKKASSTVVVKDKDLDKEDKTKNKKELPKQEVKEQPIVAIAPVPTVEPPVKETPKKPYNPDESIMQYAQKPADKIFTSAKDYYKLGQLVDVKIANIQSYGAFCEINDGRGFQALCHISEIVDGHVKKVTDFVEVGDIIQKARIVLIENKRINVSMKHLHLQKKEEENVAENVSLPENPPVNVIGEKFGSLKDKLLQRAVENKPMPNDEKEVEEIFSKEGMSDSQKEIIQKYERDIEEMTSYLQEQLGALTSQAKLELAGIIEEQGVFKTTRGILKTQENFKADIGLLFMRQMREKLGEYL